MNRRRLHRSSRDRRLAGVAGGLAEYFDLDPSLVRVLWVLSVFFGGFGIFAYIVLALVVPEEPAWGPTGPWGSDSAPWQASYGPSAGQPMWQSTGATGGTSPGDAAGMAPGGTAADGTPLAGAPGAGGQPPYTGGAPYPGSTPWTPWWTAPEGPRERRRRRGSGFGAQFFGLLMILFGSLALAAELVPDLARQGHLVWPAFILGAGILLVLSAIRRRSHSDADEQPTAEQPAS